MCLRFKYLGSLLCALLAAATAAHAAMEAAPASRAFIEADGASLVPFGPDRSHLKQKSAMLRGADLPSRYDLREEGGMTAVKEQRWSDCWAFAALGSAESIWKMKTGETIDLSERHLTWFAKNSEPGFGIAENGGANDNVATAVLARWIGAVRESDLPYSVSSPTGVCSDYKAVMHLQHAYFLALEHLDGYDRSDAARRKALIKRHGGLSAAVRSIGMDSAAYCNFDTAASYYDGESTVDHQVVLCGWDDDFPREKFKADKRPSSNGAWLVKNSRGARAGDGGYFWVSYEDHALSDGVAYIMVPADDYDKLYEHDELGWNWSAGVGGSADEAWMANVFTSGGGAETLRAVSFYTTGNGAEYEVRIYTDLLDASDPSSGTLAATSRGTEEYAGYHTVDLGQSIGLAPESLFAVVVRMRTPGYAYPIPIESPMPAGSSAVRIYQNVSAAAGESFVSTDGSTWTDARASILGADEKAVNVCVKAFVWTPEGRKRKDEPPASGGGSGGCSAGAALAAAAMAAFTISTRKGRR